MLRVTMISFLLLSSLPAAAFWDGFREGQLEADCRAGKRDSCYELRALLDRKRAAQEQDRHDEMMRALRDVRDARR